MASLLVPTAMAETPTPAPPPATKVVTTPVSTSIPLTSDQRLAYLEKALAASNAKLELFSLEIRLFRLRDQSQQAIERSRQAEQLVQEKQDASFREAYKPAEATFRQSDAELQAATTAAKTALKVPDGWVVSADGKEFKPPPPPAPPKN